MVFDFHSFRHTFITNLVKGGASPKIAQGLARHSKITVTMDESKGEGTLVGNEIKWTITLNTPMGDLDASFTGTVEGDSMNGDVEISGMTLEWTGIKIE